MSCAMPTDSPRADGGLTDDGFLGSRLKILQPKRGHRAGLDAVFLAAATPASAGETVLDAGAGVGVAGLCLSARVPDIRMTLLEIEPELASLARQNAARNGMAATVEVIEADILALDPVRGGRPAGFDHVIANPPFYAAGTVSDTADAGRKRAHQLARGDLDAWVRFLHAQAAPRGVLTMIHRPAALPDLLGAFEGRFGAVRVYPLFPRPGEPALRILVRAGKGRRGELALLPGLVLHDADGSSTAEAESVLRDGRALVIE